MTVGQKMLDMERDIWLVHHAFDSGTPTDGIRRRSNEAVVSMRGVA